jgi:hypothetical protein
MIKSIFGYVLKRESYRKFREFQNLNSQDKANSLDLLTKIICYLIWGVFCISIWFDSNFLTALIFFLCPVSFVKIISAAISYNKKTKEVFESVPVTKSDRRYKTGYRISHYKRKVLGYTKLSVDEINVRKNHFRGKFILWIFIFVFDIISFKVTKIDQTFLNSEKTLKKNIIAPVKDSLK